VYSRESPLPGAEIDAGDKVGLPAASGTSGSQTGIAPSKEGIGDEVTANEDPNGSAQKSARPGRCSRANGVSSPFSKAAGLSAEVTSADCLLSRGMKASICTSSRSHALCTGRTGSFHFESGTIKFHSLYLEGKLAKGSEDLDIDVRGFDDSPSMLQ